MRIIPVPPRITRLLERGGGAGGRMGRQCQCQVLDTVSDTFFSVIGSVGGEGGRMGRANAKDWTLLVF